MGLPIVSNLLWRRANKVDLRLAFDIGSSVSRTLLNMMLYLSILATGISTLSIGNGDSGSETDLFRVCAGAGAAIGWALFADGAKIAWIFGGAGAITGAVMIWAF